MCDNKNTTILDDWNCSDDDDNDDEMNKTIYSLMTKRKDEIETIKKKEYKKNILKKLSEIPSLNFSLITENKINEYDSDEETKEKKESPLEKGESLDHKENENIIQKLQTIENQLDEIKNFYTN